MSFSKTEKYDDDDDDDDDIPYLQLQPRYVRPYPHGMSLLRVADGGCGLQRRKLGI
jgi:hypothetical protein